MKEQGGAVSQLHDVIDKWQNFSEQKGNVSRHLPLTLAVYGSRPTS